MFGYTLSDIASITQSTCIGLPSHFISHIQLDSRTYFGGNQHMFVAIVGNQHNGHSFIDDMYSKGCRCFWVQHNQKYTLYNDAHYIVSHSVLDSFQSLISHYRNCYVFPIIAITGSNGKTIVKEWLYHILKHSKSVVRSPKSYNSQIGVPLSIMLLDSQYDMGIFEAGISQVHEMQKLEKMIKPSIGIFTNIGDAHQENFESLQQKVQEKMKLFDTVQKLVYCADYELIHTEAQKLQSTQCIAWSFFNQTEIVVSSKVISTRCTHISIHWNAHTYVFEVPFSDKASIENAIHCYITLKTLGLSEENISHFKDLPQVAMRLEQKAGKHNCTIVNDSYNSDFLSVKIAFEFLAQQKQHDSKTVILSDIKQTGIALDILYKQIYDVITEFSISRVIGVGKDISTYLSPYLPQAQYFETTQAFLEQFSTFTFENEAVLLKAAREFQFELIAQKLEFQTHQTVLEINLNAIIHNLNYFKSYLLPQTKVMVMVKAFSYGSGSYEIANVLQHHRVDYLAVAFVDEGIELRNAGITLPIVVMNPEYGVMEHLFEYNLEPEIHNFSVLEEYAKLCAKEPLKKFPIHIKLDTGMARYGFVESEIAELITKIKEIPNCKIDSIFSHLAGSDESRFDDFTQEQLQLFELLSTNIMANFDYTIMRHILNSAGIERFASYQFDMVRLGIGLYGISAEHEQNCMHVSSLKTFVSGIRTVPTGATVGYSRNGKVTKNSRIAVLPIGYADGFNRKLSNGVGTVFVNNYEVPIIGNVCMDATMIDVTDVPVELGDEVVLFGKELPISLMAKRLGTIPYEVITSIARRVKRIYYYE